jgi:hypothetical protein
VYRFKEKVERDLQMLEVRRWRELVKDREKWRGIVRQAKSPQRAVGPTEKEVYFVCLVMNGGT